MASPPLKDLSQLLSVMKAPDECIKLLASTDDAQAQPTAAVSLTKRAHSSSKLTPYTGESQPTEG